MRCCMMGVRGGWVGIRRVGETEGSGAVFDLVYKAGVYFWMIVQECLRGLGTWVFVVRMGAY